MRLEIDRAAYENVYIHNDWSVLGRYMQDCRAGYILCEDTFGSTLGPDQHLVTDQRAAADFAAKQRGKGYLYWGDSPWCVRIESEEIRRALNKPLDEMAKAVKDALDATPPDLASDLMYYGILLTGGGALLRGLDVRLRDETGVSVNVSPTALDNVVNGCARVLEANAFDGGFVQTNA